MNLSYAYYMNHINNAAKSDYSQSDLHTLSGFLDY